MEISVADNGTGIKKSNMSKLFQLYGFINETEEVNTRGIGLGLHISRKIVRSLVTPSSLGHFLSSAATSRASLSGAAAPAWSSRFTFVVKLNSIDHFQLTVFDRTRSAR